MTTRVNPTDSLSVKTLPPKGKERKVSIKEKEIQVFPTKPAEPAKPAESSTNSQEAPQTVKPFRTTTWSDRLADIIEKTVLWWKNL